MFVKIQEINNTIMQWLYTTDYIIYMKKLHNNNNVYIHNYCHPPNITNDKEEAVQLIYLSRYYEHATIQ